MRQRFFVLLSFVLALMVGQDASAQSWKQDFIQSLKNGGALVIRDDGKVLLEHRGSELFIPASTQKVATAACALKILGAESHFPTEFYVTPTGEMVVKGYGDPTLVSEELDKIALTLKEGGFKKMTGLILDDSYFADNINIDGQGSTGRAYDASNGALVANYNTIHVKKLKSGEVVSMEPQTPLTPIAIKKAKSYKGGTLRVNLGNNQNTSALFFGELFTEFLKKNGVAVSGGMRIATVPADAKLHHRHESTKSLEKVLRNMLDYSTNFTANQLVLIMGAKVHGVPATIEKGVDVVSEFLKTDVGLQNFRVAEGSGLSRLNKISPREMVALLDYFEPYQKLLDFKDGVFHATTGTLNGVNTYAGYIDLPNGKSATFAIFVNDQVPFDHKFTMARKLYLGITGYEVPRKDKGRSAEGYEEL